MLLPFLTKSSAITVINLNKLPLTQCPAHTYAVKNFGIKFRHTALTQHQRLRNNRLAVNTENYLSFAIKFPSSRKVVSPLALNTNPLKVPVAIPVE